MGNYKLNGIRQEKVVFENITGEYNKNLMEAGTIATATAKLIKAGKIIKATILIPQDKIEEVNKKKNWSLPVDDNTMGIKVFIRGGEATAFIIYDVDGTIRQEARIAGFLDQTKRGIRQHEKLIEGIEAIAGRPLDWSTDSSLRAIPDCFKSKGATPLSVDDLLDSL